jgi:hypothetical protein
MSTWKCVRRVAWPCTTLGGFQQQFRACLQQHSRAPVQRLQASSWSGGGGGGRRYQRFQQNANYFQRWARSPTFYYQIAGLSGAVGVFYVYNLEQVPVSGRRRFNIISVETEMAMAQEMYAQIMREYNGRILPVSHVSSCRMSVAKLPYSCPGFYSYLSLRCWVL